MNVENVGGDVQLRVLDVKGRTVRTLLAQPLPTNNYFVPWLGRSDDGRRMPSGVYFYELRSGGQVSRKKMILFR